MCLIHTSNVQAWLSVIKNRGVLLFLGRKWALGSTVELCHWSKKKKKLSPCLKNFSPEAGCYSFFCRGGGGGGSSCTVFQCTGAIICAPTLQSESHWYFSWNFDFYTLVKSIHFPFKWYQKCANLPTGSKVIDKSMWLLYRVPFWEIGLRKFVLHITVFQQLQFKMPESVINHHIWPLKVVFSNRKMPEAPNFDENNIFDLQIENRCTLYCDRVSVGLISGGRVTFINWTCGELLSCWLPWVRHIFGYQYLSSFGLQIFTGRRTMIFDRSVQRC